MVRRQIQLTDVQDEAVRREAVERGLSIAAVIRELVEASLQQERAGEVERALGVFGRHRSGLHDVAERHDDHLVDAFST